MRRNIAATLRPPIALFLIGAPSANRCERARVVRLHRRNALRSLCRESPKESVNDSHHAANYRDFPDEVKRNLAVPCAFLFGNRRFSASFPP